MPRALAAALVAALLLAACARPAPSDAARPRPVREVAAVVHGASRAAAAAGSGRFRVTLRIEATDGSARPVVVDVTTVGAFDGPRRELRSDLGAAIAALEGSGASLPPGFDEPVQVVVDGASTYLRAPMLDELIGAPRWLLADHGGPDAELGPLGMAAIGGGIGAVDPLPVLEALTHASAVDDVGADEVDGARARRLRAQIDLSGVLDGLGPVTAVPVELWVDGAGRARRLVADLGDAGALLGEGQGAPAVPGMAGSATMIIELYDYGADLQIATPDPEIVMPADDARRAMSQALGQAGRGAG